ncbi:hypothetical protein B0H12DRAFT_776477 [Mycena haematopus]|nr:hypothetical protein B0H12DRAFT_776477 [Mycena haematopus]
MLACHVLEGDVPLPPLASGTTDPSSDAESDPSPQASFNGPLEAHILPGRGVHTCAVLPFLCVADQDNIADLMGSVACQRQVWGIPFPVVGFSLSGTVMTLVLSSLDPATSTVYIAPSVSNGVFDLTDTDSTLSLAQFVLNLSPHFACVLERTKERSKLGFENNAFDWRLDSILPSHECGNWRDRVVQWLQDVEMPPSLSLPTAYPDAEIPPRNKKNQTSDQSENPEAKSETQSETPTHQSGSTYAARTIRSLDDDEGHLLTWMFDRSVQTIARIPVKNAKGEQQNEINEKIKLYDEMCGLQGLDDPATLPEVDGTVSSIRDVLISQLQRRSQLPLRPTDEEEDLTDDEEDLTDDEEDLTDDEEDPPDDEDLPILLASHQAILLGRLSALLSATNGAYIMDHQREDVPGHEAESRYHWHSLFYHFYCQASDKISPYVMLEHVINYPRNDLADKIDSAASIDLKALKKGSQAKLFDAQVERTLNNIVLRAAAVSTAVDQDLGRDVVGLAVAAATQANDMYQILARLEPTQFREMVNTRSNFEPTQGTCDTILFISIPNRSDLCEGLEIIRHLHSSSPAFGTGSGVASSQGSTTDDGVAHRLENTIHYPRNHLADEIDSAASIDPKAVKDGSQAKLLAAQVIRTRTSRELCSQTYDSAALMFLAPDVLETANAATNQATRMFTTLVDFTRKPAQFRKMVNTRSTLEPTQGTCDAVLFMLIPNRSDLSEGLGIIRHICPSSAASGAAGGVASGEGSTDDGPANYPASIDAASSQDDMKADAAQAPDDGQLHVSAAPKIAPPDAKHPLDYFDLASFKNDLLLPHATAAYKKNADSEIKVLNQGRLSLISVVSFYAALGIDDYPFYNVVAEGKYGTILMGWKSKSKAKAKSDPDSQSQSVSEELPEIYIMERNVCILDISKPLEAFQFATFLIRLREDQEALKKRVEEILDADAAGAVARIARWRKIAQLSAKELETSVRAQKAAAQGEKAPASPSLVSLPKDQKTIP